MLEMAVHPFITSHFDYWNSLYCGIAQSQIIRQNGAARFITNSRKYDNISAILPALHWLPIQYRIVFKSILFGLQVFTQPSP